MGGRPGFKDEQTESFPAEPSEGVAARVGKRVTAVPTGPVGAFHGPSPGSTILVQLPNRASLDQNRGRSERTTRPKAHGRGAASGATDIEHQSGRGTEMPFVVGIDNQILMSNHERRSLGERTEGQARDPASGIRGGLVRECCSATGRRSLSMAGGGNHGNREKRLYLYGRCRTVAG